MSMQKIPPTMKPGMLYAGTHRRAHRADPVDVAFGIYAFRKEGGSGQLSRVDLTETPQPGWIALHPSGRYLYAANEVRGFEGADGGGVSAFAIDPETGLLSPLNTRRTPPLPCHCEVDASGRCLLVATFGGGTVHLFPLEPDGRIGPEADAHQHKGSSVHPRRQTHPHAHAVVIDPANRFVLVPDLGTDRIIVYEMLPASGRLLSRPERDVRLAPGSGPRHLAFHPQARFVYLMNEMSAKITTFAYDMQNGGLQEIQTVDALPEGFSGLRSGAELSIHPAGRFLYATTRSHGSSGEPPARGIDSVVWFEIDAEHGVLHPRGRIFSGGEIPRTFTFDSSGEYLFVGHQCSGTVVTFRIHPQTGAPIATGDVISTPVPVCLRFSYRN
jgi:6-phosphogluconolactonase